MILTRAQKAGVTRIINISTTPEELEKGYQLPSWISQVASTTPHDAEKYGEAHFPYFKEQALSKKLVAVGETGLDYHYYKETKQSQQYWLRNYIELAHQAQLPLVIHCREAFEDLFRILDEEKAPRGVLHCFTGTLEEAQEVIKRGWYLSLSGIVTFKKSEWLREVAKEIPLNQLLIETDSPYLAPQPFRSQRNEPAFIVETVKVLASLLGLSFEEVATATSKNSQSLFRL